ncbi:MAG: ATP-binding cassette domain-containing protein [Lachnospiraceae bacterium]|nr:ATP-binding cassette domain-containing protein [Lachnospiraceae bacterium]
MVLSIQNVSKFFSAGPVLKDISFQVNEGDKLAIIGNNGTGKSTLLKIIVGEEHEDSGEIVLGKNATLGYLAQYQTDNLSGNIYDIVLSAREDLLHMEKELRNMEMKMCDVDLSEMDHFMDVYHRKSKEFEDLGGLTFRSEVSGVLKGLGFSEEDFEKDLETLSGGQKTRVAMGRLLIQKPSVLLLDEPINHLDLNSIQWLEGYLAQYDGAVIIVAHDRYFLDRVVNRVVDLSNHTAVCYKGNYSEFMRQKEERMKTLLRQYEKQEKYIEHQEAVIDKLRQFNREKSIKRAESRVKALDKVERIDAPMLDSQKMVLSLEPDIRSGNDVLTVDGISKSYDGESLFENLSFSLHRQDRVAILGDNGTGKTTILKLITGKKEKDAGVITLGANVTVGYYDQEQQELDEEKTLFEEMQDAYPNLNDTRIRNVLAAFLFTGDEVFQPIKTLSGGERGRISLAKLMLSGANFLILDEPTNHLDMESKEILEHALSGYTGTLLYVSHDRYFIQKTATRILELEDHSLTEYQGDYEYYLRRKEELKEKAALSTIDSTKDASGSQEQGKMDWASQKEEAKRIQKLEREKDAIEAEISDLEEQLSFIEKEFEKDEVAHNSAMLNELTEKQAALNARLEQCYEKWEDLEMALS